MEIVVKFNNNIFTKYQLNITKFKTLPGLALAAYTSNYIPDNLKSEIKMIKGELEKEIRTSYYGGNVDVFINYIENGYYYDMNSQYPKAMLEDMPVGDPNLSLEKDLNKIFGFIYGEITCPEEDVLRVPFVQYRTPVTDWVSCPTSKRGTFSRLIFSEEIKYAIKFGYSINIEYCYIFERGKDLFKDFVIDHFEIKKNTSDPELKLIAKLILNSLYGRMGMKDIENIIKIVDIKEAENLDKMSNVSVFSKLSDEKVLVKYSGQLNENLRKLYSNYSLGLEKNKTIMLNKTELKNSGLNKKVSVPSAVHIAAAITAYARILINDYKNIPGNPCIMSDTDSAVLPYPLPDHLVGDNLGKMRLIYKVNSGIFIKKKLYCILDENNNLIVKSSGIDPSKLNYKLFEQLLLGNSVEVTGTSFNVDWKTLNINVVDSQITIQGLKGEIKTIPNNQDVDFKDHIKKDSDILFSNIISVFVNNKENS